MNSQKENENEDIKLDTIFDSKLPPMGLETEDYRKAAHAMVSFIIDFYDKVKTYNPSPNVKPGFMRELVKNEAPFKAEKWEKVFKDLDDVIIRGLLHYQSPGYFGYFPTSTSYPSMLGEMLCTAVATIVPNWAAGPSSTELETIVLDWLAKALNLPQAFLHNGTGPGAGVIQGSASEATLVTMIAARQKVIRQEQEKYPNKTKYEIASKMVAYTSKVAHSSVERAALISFMEIRTLDVDSNASLRGPTLMKAIEEDRAKGNIPFYVCATIGTTACCSFDNLEVIGDICKRENVWLHVDGAYAGNALICPEFRYICKGLEKANSFVANANKMLMVHFDCTVLWLQDSKDLVNSMQVDATYLQNNETQPNVIDYRHWQIPLSRRFRSIKLWFVLRMIGIEGLRHHVRKGVAEAKYFEKLIKEDSRFEIMFPVHLGLVCLRFIKPGADLKELNYINEKLCNQINADKRIFLSPATVNEVFFLRVSMISVQSSMERVNKCWQIIQEFTELINGLS